MTRLYLRIYLAVVASLAIFALIAGVAWHLGRDAYEPRREHAAQLAGELVAELLPADAGDLAGAAAVLQRWQSRARVDLALYGRDGRLLAAAGAPLERPTREQAGWGPAGGGPPVFVAELPDGRQLLLRRAGPPRGPWRGAAWPGFLAVLLAIAVAVGIAAYPVVRRLTGRIERLQRSVEALGAGNLSTRVRVEGRDEVASLARSFNQSAQRIETLMQSQKDLLANASHELRSPLARIRMALALLPGERDGSLFRELDRDIGELDQLIDEILLASRLDAGHQGLRKDEEVDLAGLCAEECARVSAQFEIASAPDWPLPLVSGDARLLRRMIRNLLENAVRYGEGKPVEVLLKSAPAGTTLSVCDRGPGVREAERERIFEPFYRADGASERHGGVGLGLALARSIATRHGAQLRCEPRSGGGSCFVVGFSAS